MKAISLHSPWAWAIMHGGKDVENRGPRFAKTVTGRVWVHASLWPNFADSSNKWLQRITVACVPINESLRLTNRTHVTWADAYAMKAMRGHIVGSVEVAGYKMPSDPQGSPWYIPGSLGIMLKDPRPLAVPVPAKGALGWWSVPDDVQALLRTAGAK